MGIDIPIMFTITTAISQGSLPIFRYHTQVLVYRFVSPLNRIKSLLLIVKPKCLITFGQFLSPKKAPLGS